MKRCRTCKIPLWIAWLCFGWPWQERLVSYREAFEDMKNFVVLKNVILGFIKACLGRAFYLNKGDKITYSKKGYEGLVGEIISKECLYNSFNNKFLRFGALFEHPIEGLNLLYITVMGQAIDKKQGITKL